MVVVVVVVVVGDLTTADCHLEFAATVVVAVLANCDFNSPVGDKFTNSASRYRRILHVNG